ncbi:hypothetical protein PILCRDRAFT_65362 [Piloderma croceum F 1598]|uniref:Major facilitator superfamily (MFS) profile domain-containing protein n=1 Tax=Piloderma croceum (strain F 1598) TaxID=765440 RepID=A0A0C3G3E4_PILCF|nr:hypothetical protein PILCRDRAFT_65362 [Piloderma croceum F 1598]
MPACEADIVVDEQTALLLTRTIKKPTTPLPRLQISVLLLLQLAEPITSQCINPFINQLVRELDITGGDERKVGFFSGLIVSLFFAVQAVAVMQWARLSDHIGRKPVLLTGLFGLFISMVLFGLSRTFWALVFSRCLAGVLNGNIGVMKTMMAELTDSTNIAQGFAFMPVVFSIGATIGPFIGALARPHDRFPIFRGAFWEKYPYFLPCIVSATYSALAFLLASCFLKETLPKILRVPDNESTEPNISKSTRESPVPLRELFIFPIVISVSNYASLALIDMAMLALLPLFYSSPIEHGGLNLSPSTIGILLGTFGLLNGVFQAFFFAKIIKRLGAKNLFITGISSSILIFLLFPLINLLALRRGVSPIVWVAVVCQLVITIIMDMSYATIFIFITSAAPNKRSLGATNGMGQTLVSICRAIGPAMSSSLFALSLEHNLMGGYAVYLVLVVTSCLALLLAAHLPSEPWQRD